MRRTGESDRPALLVLSGFGIACSSEGAARINEETLSDFAGRVPDVLRAAVVTSDGVLVAASATMRPDEAEQLSAITAGLISLAGTSARILDNGAVIQALVTMARGTLVIMAIDDGASLVVLTTATADLDLVAYEMTMLAEEADGVLAPPRRRPARDPAKSRAGSPGPREEPGGTTLPQRRQD